MHGGGFSVHTQTMKKIYLCFVLLFICANIFSAEYTYTPSTISELKAKLNGNLQPGDIVYLNDGIYPNFQVIFSGSGTQTNPITLKSKNAGKAILTGNLNIKIGGDYLIVDGLVLKDGMAANGTDIIEFRTSSSTFAYNCRLTNTVIDNCNNPDEAYRANTDLSERWVMLYGKSNRVDHCYFSNKINGGVLMMVNVEKTESQDNNHLIDYNFFSYRPKFDPGNNAETIRLGDSKTSQLSSMTTVENNVFYTCNGEVEIISIKSCDNIIRKNVFYESQGSVVCRHGHRNTIESNAFIGNNVNNCGGVRIINQGHKVYNNFFQDLNGTGSRSALCVMMGIFEKPTSSTDTDKEPLNAYHRVKDVDISYNTFVNCANIDLGTDCSYTYSSSNPFYPEQKVYGTLKPECIIARNVFYNPTSSNCINKISGNADLMIFSDNIYKFSKTISLSGFTSRNLDYKQYTDQGKGIYYLANTQDIVLYAPNSATDFNYVTSDISGAARSGIKSMGAQQFDNKEKAFATVRPNNCGTAWYESQQTDLQSIRNKTDFWETSSGITSSTQNPFSIQIYKHENNTYRITSDEQLISSVHIYSLNGLLITKQQVNDYSTIVDCTHFQSGIYLMKVKNDLNESVTSKILV